jgi:pyruvate dehydrogenase E2 component (dihydrolipoamide acetyltransferase)
VDVTMPQLGETVTEGTITRWLKQVGEAVEADEPLFEVSTDKVDSEVPAPSAGVVSEILVPEGETVEVGTRLAVLADSGSGAAPAPAAEAAPAPPAPAAASPPAEPAPAPAEPAPAPAEPAPAPAEPAPAPAEPAPAPPPPVPAPAAPAAQEPEPAPTPAPPVAQEQQAVEAPAPDGDDAGGLALTSPIVRRLVAERGLDPAKIVGTGPGGRLTRKDVLDAAAQDTGPPAAQASAPAPAPAAPTPAPPAPPTPAPAAAAAPPPAPAAPAPAAPAPAAPAPATSPSATSPPRAARDEIVPYDNIRRRTAEHMVRSLATSAHVYTSVEVDFERVEQARRAHRDEWKANEGFSLTYLPFIARAFCDTVNDFPRVNASVGDDVLVVHHDVHLSIAVDLAFEGLVAPVVKDADGKRLRLIAREIHDLANRARSRQLVPDDVLGGTFTITNPGPYGTFMTLPIINQPQVAILSTDSVKQRPVVVNTPAGDAIAIHHTGILALTWDHRAFDGAYAAAFLGAMREVLEERDWEAELD